MVVEAAHPEEGQQRRCRVGRLTLEEELGIVVLHRRLDRRRAVHHDDTESDERDGDGRQHGIDRRAREALVGVRVEGREQLHRRPADVALHVRAGLHRETSFASACTSRTNSSPRCL